MLIYNRTLNIKSFPRNCEVIMRTNTFNPITKAFVLCLLTASVFGQRIDREDLANNDLRMLVENASRSQQVVWVEDFTGLN